jgi:hypothetical protein
MGESKGHINQHYTDHMSRHDGRLSDSCSPRPTCRDYSKAASLLIGHDNVQHFHQVSLKVHHLLDQVFVRSPVLHALMSYLLLMMRKNCNAFASCCFLRNSSPRYHSIHFSEGILANLILSTFESHVAIGYPFLESSIPGGGHFCTKHMH